MDDAKSRLFRWRVTKISGLAAHHSGTNKDFAMIERNNVRGSGVLKEARMNPRDGPVGENRNADMIQARKRRLPADGLPAPRQGLLNPKANPGNLQGNGSLAIADCQGLHAAGLADLRSAGASASSCSG